MGEGEEREGTEDKRIVDKRHKNISENFVAINVKKSSTLRQPKYKMIFNYH